MRCYASYRAALLKVNIMSWTKVCFPGDSLLSHLCLLQSSSAAAVINQSAGRMEQWSLRWHVAHFDVTGGDVPLKPTPGNPRGTQGEGFPSCSIFFFSAEVNQAKRYLTGFQSTSLDGYLRKTKKKKTVCAKLCPKRFRQYGRITAMHVCNVVGDTFFWPWSVLFHLALKLLQG